MPESAPPLYTAFAGQRLIASGELPSVARAAKILFDKGEAAPIFIFEDATGKLIDIDLRGTPDEFLRTMPTTDDVSQPAATETKRPGPGRPRLGVVAREVTLLPRHWEWLNAQPGGASVTLRKLVENARRAGKNEERVRILRDGAYKFMSFMAGDFVGFEEAARALFAGDYMRFDRLITDWPADVRAHLRKLIKDVQCTGNADVGPETRG